MTNTAGRSPGSGVSRRERLDHSDDASLWTCTARRAGAGGDADGILAHAEPAGAITTGGLVATMAIESPTDTDGFLIYLEQCAELHVHLAQSNARRHDFVRKWQTVAPPFGPVRDAVVGPRPAIESLSYRWFDVRRLARRPRPLCVQAFLRISLYLRLAVSSDLDLITEFL